MAFYDWNKDGKNNNTDNYIENEIYKKFSFRLTSHIQDL